jgi:hypothetical protein
MKLFRSLSIALVLAFTAGTALADKPADKPAAGSGAGSASGSAPALTDQDKADIAKWLVFFDSIVDTVVKDKDNCPTMAADINALVDKNADLIKKAEAAVAAGKKLDDASKKHMMDSVKKMIPAMQKCGTDKDVQAAMMRMQPGKPAPKGTK